MRRYVSNCSVNRKAALWTPALRLTMCHVTHANRHLCLSYKQCDRVQHEFLLRNRGFSSVFEWFSCEEMSEIKAESKNDNNIEDVSKVSGEKREKYLHQAEFSC